MSPPPRAGKKPPSNTTPAHPRTSAAAYPRRHPRPPTPHGVGRPAPGPQSDPARASAKGLKVLVAGVDKETRWAVESIVREALGQRASSEEWTVSLVKLAGKWSVTLDGPGERFRGVSLTAADDRLGQAIRAAVSESGREERASPSTDSGGSTAASNETRTRLACERCRGAIVIIYPSQPGEPKVAAAVACPHCWAINHVEIGDWAAAGREYRAEKG